ncbi:MAG: phenol hydroxylase subunit [Actinomycetota bacterium]
MINEKTVVEGRFDTARKYVRVCNQRPDGFVEFEFAIGDPDLCIELMLPANAFHEFCLANDVIVLERVAEQEGGDWVQRLNEASRRGFEDAV